MKVKYLHTMVRVADLDETDRLLQADGPRGDAPHQQREAAASRWSFWRPPGQPECPDVELTYNWDGDEGLPSDSRHFGHLAYAVENIYDMCQKLQDDGVTINRPPRDGHMAFVRSPDNVSVELLQMGDACRRRSPGRAWTTPATGRRADRGSGALPCRCRPHDHKARPRRLPIVAGAWSAPAPLSTKTAAICMRAHACT